MADYSTTTPAGVLKSASRAHPDLSRITLRFRGLLKAMDSLIVAEDELGNYSGQDPALDAWIRDAETARTHTLAVIESIVAMPIVHVADAHLARIARLFRMVMISDDPAQVDYLRARAAETDRFLLPGGDPLHFKLNQMILGALERLERYAALDNHEPDEPTRESDAADVMPTPTI